MASFLLKDTQIAITPFYDRSQPLFCLTNFSQHPITINGLVYPTTEHFFQSQKFTLAANFLRETASQGPMNALTVAREWTKSWTTQDWQKWDARKETVMEKALRAKLKQHPSIAKELIDTGMSCLVEDTAERNEAIWGWGNDGKGTNKLGILWMKLRNELHSSNNRNELIVDPDDLYAKVQSTRVKLGVRKQIMQHWSDAKPLTQPTQAKNTTADSILVLAQDIRKQMQPGESAVATSIKGEILRFGISKRYNSFYIHGTNNKGAPISVYVKDNAIYENNLKVAASSFVKWALPIIRNNSLQLKKPALITTMPEPLATKSNPAATKPTPSNTSTGIAYAVLVGILGACVLLVKWPLPIALCWGAVTTLASAIYFYQQNSSQPIRVNTMTNQVAANTANVDLTVHRTLLQSKGLAQNVTMIKDNVKDNEHPKKASNRL